MAYEQKDNSGSLFRNERKETQKHPDFTGSAKINGVEYWLSAWMKPGQNGKKGFFSLAFTPKDQQQAARTDAQSEPGGGSKNGPADFSDLPF